MKILINQTIALRQKAGVGHCVCELVRCLSARIRERGSRDDRLVLYPGSWVGWTQWGLGGMQMARRGLRRIKASLGGDRGGTDEDVQHVGAGALGNDLISSWVRRIQTWHQRKFWPREFDIYHEPNHFPFPCDKPTIVTVHDLSALLHPHWHPLERARKFAKHFVRGVEQCAHVVTVSEFSRREIVKHLAVPPERVTCTPNGVRAGFRPLPRTRVLAVLQRLRLPENYLLHVGTLEPRKNLLMLLRAYTALPNTVREQAPLILAGDWGWNRAELMDFYHRQARHKGVRQIGYIADEDLPALYNGAGALVYPSHYEGFGLPPLEMMACGGAVLGSTAAAVVETVGSRAHLLDPLDQDAWQQAMQRVILDEDWRQELRRGTRELAEPYTWERTAEATWEVYRRVLGFGASRQARAA